LTDLPKGELPAPRCSDCAAFRAETREEGQPARGRCRLRPELGTIPEHLPVCHIFQVRADRAEWVQVLPARRRPPPVDRDDDAAERASLQHPTTGDTSGEITMDRDGLKQVLRELLEEETLYGYPEIGQRWEGGTLVLKPASPENQPKEVDLATFFHKIVMIRDRLRVLEAKLNAHEKLSEADKIELQGYISKCYGTLTTFNVLFKNSADQFSSQK
jgi:hypothetical protein